MESFLGLLHRTFGIGEPDSERLKLMLEPSFAIILSALRDACERWNVDYPENVEQSIRETYRVMLDLEIPTTRL